MLVCCSYAGRDETSAGGEAAFLSLFADNCSGCHGVDGKDGAVQSLSDSLYLTVMPKDELQRVIGEGRAGTSMPAFAASSGGALTDKQISVLVEGIEKWQGQTTVNGGQPPPYASTLKGDTDRGKQLFTTNCTGCHQADRVGPIDDRNYLALVSDQSLRTTMIVGRPALGMPTWRTLKAGNSLEDQDIADVVAYLGSLRLALSGGGNEHAVGPGEGSGNGPG